MEITLPYGKEGLKVSINKRDNLWILETGKAKASSPREELTDYALKPSQIKVVV